MSGIIKNKDLQKDIANQVHDMMLGRLQDIEGVDSINWFPLAPGWWILIAIFSLAMLMLIISKIRKMLFRRTWQYKILQELEQMQKTLILSNVKETITRVSEIVRRLAIYKYSRSECAQLEGESWLKWLSEHDKNRFDWQKNGKLLIEIPYAPQIDEKTSLKMVLEIIEATKNWVV